MKKFNQVLRHGDMIIFKITDDQEFENKNSKSMKNQEFLVGLGEVTGHAHEVTALADSEIVAYYDTEEEVTSEDLANMDKLLFEIKGAGAIIHHEEHNPHLLTAGKYMRIVQVEKNPWTNQLEQIRD